MTNRYVRNRAIEVLEDVPANDKDPEIRRLRKNVKKAYGFFKRLGNGNRREKLLWHMNKLEEYIIEHCSKI